MKKCTLLLVLLLNHISYAQTEIDQILEIGIENAQRFSKDYFASAGESLVNAMSNGWYSTAKTKKLWHFEAGIVGNLSFVREEKQSFIMNTAEYTGLTFRDGSNSQSVSNALGSSQNDITVVFNEGTPEEVEVVLPNGIGDSETNSLPSGFIQGSLGLIKSTEIKIRFLPKIKAVQGAEIQLYGVAFQHEFTDWVFPLKRWPVHLSALLGYTNVKGFYDIEGDDSVLGTGREVRLVTNSWLLTSIVSTKFPVFNVYGGLGYYFGSSNADVLGVYQIQKGPLRSQTIENPISVKSKTKGVKASIGAKAKFGIFSANLDYTLQNYNNFSLGLNFGW
ncbi:DUF6588 family protein [Aquimarina muelleri]|uniref:Outer membrane protein beta-barrel domain-containing protein n=1 Tax=Aquimarina muelleri TaxID=279356 RepID=A0A918N3N5_9FLAO|nr:DUF6588 family protein [Aquimarina muelleri]MCX2764427.1 hypothetical protein [Aquimarina muelleri]GGX21265.1 hypothetical protein GCM10007384_23110 [Aquimarina muelleri]